MEGHSRSMAIFLGYAHFQTPIGCIPWPLSTLRWSWGWTDTQCAGDDAWGFRRPGTTGIPIAKFVGLWVSRCPSLPMAIWDGITGHQNEQKPRNAFVRISTRWPGDEGGMLKFDPRMLGTSRSHAEQTWCDVRWWDRRCACPFHSISSRKNQGDIPDISW